MRVRQPDSHGNGTATTSFDARSTSDYGDEYGHLYRGELLKVWVHSAESIDSFGGAAGENGLAAASIRFRR